MFTNSWLRRLRTGILDTLLDRRARVARTSLHRRSTSMRLEQLEDRLVPASSWQTLAASGSAPPNGGAAMMLLSDGNVLIQDGLNVGGAGGQSANMFELSPQVLTGDYVNGAWTDVNDMNEARLFFTTAMMSDGRIFAVGGEYPSFSRTAEIFDPLANAGLGSWTYVDSVPTSDSKFGDDPIEVIAGGPNNGQILAGYYNDQTTYRFNPAAAAGSQWTKTAKSDGTNPGKLHGDASDEEAWVKLKDGSILSYDIFASGGGTFQAQRYIPATDKWVDASNLSATNPPSILESNGAQGRELGPAFLQPDGKVIYFGANGNTAIYDPVANEWSAGFAEPQKNLTVTRTGPVGKPSWSVSSGSPSDTPTFLVGTDDPGAMLPNGHILIALSPLGPLNSAADGGGYSFPNATYIYEYDPTATTAAAAWTEVTPGGLSSINAFATNMVVLPTGQVLFSVEGGAFQIYTEDPATGPQDAWRPTISSIVDNGDGTFALKGTQLNGISEGANYGDDNQSASNYPIIQFTKEILGFPLEFYARTFNWSSNGVATGGTLVSTQFTLPGGFSSLSDFDSVVVIANGIPSDSVASRANPNVIAPSDQTAVEGASKSFNLGSFIDPDDGPWSVDVNWGDGTAHTTFGVSSAGSLGTQSHTYAEEGSYTVTVTVTDSTSLSGSASFHVSSSDPAVSAIGGFSLSAVEGAPSASQTVATFTDPGGAESLVDYSALINWGDGTAATAGSISFFGGTFTVKGSHIYAEESAPEHTGSNPYDITVTISHDVAPTSTVHSSATVSDPTVSASGGFSFSAVEGSLSASQTIATFTDPGGSEPVGDYSADIDWHDGTTSTGTIGFDSGGGFFTVSAAHLYGEEGTYAITVTIHHESATDVTTASTATVTDPAVIPTGGFSLTTARGAPLCDVTVATFTDPGGAEPNSFDPSGVHYTADINWGDGTPSSAGEISFSGSPGSKTDAFTVTGDHTYVANGTYTLKVTIHHESATDVMTTSTATVKSVAIGQGPCDPDTLLIGGTLGADSIRVTPQGSSGNVQVLINSEPAVIVSAASFSSIAIYAQAGDDDAQVDSSVNRTVFEFGGDGNDRLKGGGGISLLAGGAGNDKLTGSSTLSVIIGGAGADTLTAQGTGDLVIGGLLDFDDPTNCDNDPKICNLLHAWADPTMSYNQRVAAVNALLSGHVSNDGAVDTLNGGPGLDVFYISAGDVLKGNQKGEIIVTI